MVKNFMIECIPASGILRDVQKSKSTKSKKPKEELSDFILSEYVMHPPEMNTTK